MTSTVRAHIAGSFVTVTVTCVASTVVAQLPALRSASGYSKLVVGLDVEWLSSDRNGKVALLQLCSGTQCLIVQLFQDRWRASLQTQQWISLELASPQMIRSLGRTTAGEFITWWSLLLLLQRRMVRMPDRVWWISLVLLWGYLSIGLQV
ncbi:unnamed protein product [Musa hybrid cultivar]